MHRASLAPFTAAVSALGALLVGSVARAAAATPPASTLESGGLKPPSAIDSDTAQPTQTEQRLDQADKDDSGRGLEFVWANLEGGGETLGLQTFKAKGLVDGTLAHSKQTGLAYGV